MAALTGFLFVILVVLIVVSAVNNDRLEVVEEDGALVLKQGDFLPWGTSNYEPSAAYAPVPIPDGYSVDDALGECDDLSECERVLYEAILGFAEGLLATGGAEELEIARDLLVRAQLFPSINLSERAPIEDLTGAVHYVEAMVLLESIDTDLTLALKKLERSRIAESPITNTAALERTIALVKAQRALMDLARTDPAPMDSPKASTP